MATEKLSAAGKKLLTDYLDAESAGKLVDAKLRDGSPAKALKFGWGDNSQKVCGERLRRQGFALVEWSRFGAGGGGLLVITESGRAALNMVPA